MAGTQASDPPNGVTATEKNTEMSTEFSWLQPHPLFVVVLVGSDETPFGIQRDLLVSKSTFYRKYFSTQTQEGIEAIVKLPHTSPEVFGLAQNYLFTGEIIASKQTLPTYETLVGVWKLGHDLGISGLCDKTLQSMDECKRLTQRIPSTPILVQVWGDTPEGSSIRKLLLSWAAQYMRSSDGREEFAKSLPQNVLSELVVAMTSGDDVALAPTTPPPPRHAHASGAKSVHYLDDSDEETRPSLKKARPLIQSRVSAVAGAVHKKPGPKPGQLKNQRRRSAPTALDKGSPSTKQKLAFCSDLISRMLSGPGFWTRLVGPFRQPVNPAGDGVPDYLDKITRPMDLGTIKTKMDGGQYQTEDEFLGDVHQIFENCYRYWEKGDVMWMACERLQKTFTDKYGQMNKWISKMEEGEDTQ